MATAYITEATAHALGLLDPHGKFYPVEYEGHADLGDELFKEQYPRERDIIMEDDAYVDGLVELRNRGWLSIHSGGDVRYPNKETVTQAQLDFLFDLLMRRVEEHGENDYTARGLRRTLKWLGEANDEK